MPDRGGEGEDGLQYSRCDARDGPAAVAFEVELGLERVIDRFDDLPKRFDVPVARPWFLALAGRPQQLDFGVGECSATPCKFGCSLWSAARNLLQRARITVSPRVFDEVYAPSRLVSSCASSGSGR